MSTGVAKNVCGIDETSAYFKQENKPDPFTKTFVFSLLFCRLHLRQQRDHCITNPYQCQWIHRVQSGCDDGRHTAFAGLGRSKGKWHATELSRGLLRSQIYQYPLSGYVQTWSFFLEMELF